MRLRSLVPCLLAGAATVAAQSPAAPPQPPVFRTGVELLTVDATVVDRDGRQVTDLTPGEFVVEVDGDPRPVVSAEYVKLVDDTPMPIGAPRPAAPAPSPDAAFFSTNARAVARGRTILLLVDEGNIRAGQGRQVMRSTMKFVDGLSPFDRVAMVAIPRGALVDFTTDHDRVREALLATVGRATPYKGRFFMSLSEAIATVEHSDAVLRAQLIMRECAAVLNNPVELTRCEIEIEQEAGEMVNHQRRQTQASLVGMREVLRSLAAIEGSKSVIVISEGLVLEGLGSDVEQIAGVAADVRASLDVLLLDVPDVDVSQRERPTTPREDRDRQESGLQMLAGMSRGSLHRVVSTADNALARIQRTLAGHYLIGVESRPSDRDGRRHRISVKTTRRGVTLLSRRGFLATTSATAVPPAEAVKRALGAPLTINDVPLRLATWTYKESGGDKVRLLVTAEIERGLDQPLDYTAGLMVVDRNNRVVASHLDARALRASDANPGVAVFSGALTLDPGTYLLRFAVADHEGRIGSVERKFDAWQMNTGELALGDLLVGEAPPDGGAVAPAIEPLVSNGRLVAMMELYEQPLALQGLDATLEIVAGDGERALLSAPLQVGTGPSADVGVAQGLMDTSALPPGRYLARATVRRDGKARGHLLRPFRVGAAAGADETTPVASTGTAAPWLATLLATLPTVDRQEFVRPDVVSAVLDAAGRARPESAAAFSAARSGGLGAAALEALASGDQISAAFLRGLEFFGQGQNDRALQQFQVAMQQAPSFAPARLYLGAALAYADRHKEAAGLLQSVTPEVAGPAPVARLAAISWLRMGSAANAIAALERAGTSGDTAGARTLALAYLAANRHADALPLLATHLAQAPTDREALLAGIYATFATHSPAPQSSRLDADRQRAQLWATAYAAQRGEHGPLVDAWMKYLREAQ